MLPILYPENSCQIHVFYSNFCFRSLRVWSLLRRPLILLGWFLCPVQHKPRPRPVPLHVEDPPAQHRLLTRPFLCTARSWRPCEGRSAACSRACWWARCSGRGVPAPRPRARAPEPGPHARIRPCAPSLRPCPQARACCRDSCRSATSREIRKCETSNRIPLFQDYCGS